MLRSLFVSTTILSKNAVLTQQLRHCAPPPDGAYWVDPNAVDKGSGLCPYNPIGLDISSPNPDGTFTAKFQGTTKGATSQNPSFLLHPHKRFDGKFAYGNGQRAVVPLKPTYIPFKAIRGPLYPSIPLLDETSVKDTLHRRGIRPSNYIDGKPYRTPLERLRIIWAKPHRTSYIGGQRIRVSTKHIIHSHREHLLYKIKV